jgi:hypothetical protein
MSTTIAYLEERIRAMPVLELLAASMESAKFRYRGDDPDGTNLHLENALRDAGFPAARGAIVEGRHALRVVAADCVSQADADALLCAVAALGAVAANGQPVPQAVLASIRSDGLPAYNDFAGLWRLELSGLEIARLGPMLDARVARNPQDAAAWMDMATLLFLTLMPVNREPAFAAQANALQLQQVYRLPARRAGIWIA